MAVVFLASDHAGFVLKEFLKKHLQDKAHQVTDLGPDQPIAVDYPDSARAVCLKVIAEPCSFGILLCGSGIGMSMAANRHPEIRAALCATEYHARLGRMHNNANVLCLGERITGSHLAASIADVFLTAEFEGGRHLRRIALFSE